MAKASYYINDEYVHGERLPWQYAERKVRYLCEYLKLPCYYVYRDSLESEGYGEIVLFRNNDGKYVVRHHTDVAKSDYEQALDLFFDLTKCGYPLFLEVGNCAFKIVVDYYDEF